MEKFFEENSFKDISNEEFLKKAHLFLISAAAIKKLIADHPNDAYEELEAKAIISGKPIEFSANKFYRMVDNLEQSDIVAELQAEAAKRGIPDLNAALVKMNYQASMDEAINTLVNERKATAKKFIKIILPIVLVLAAAYIGYKYFVKGKIATT